MSTSKSRPTAVLIHGLSETRAAWSRQLDFLRQHMRVISYDVRGFGDSPAGRGDGTVEQFADDLSQILSSHEASPAWLVGFSMGGVIAQRFAIDFPQMVQGLVLVASSCVVGRPGQAFFRERVAQVTQGGLDAVASITDGDARGCFSSGHEDLVSEYQQLRCRAVRDPSGYLNACYAMLRLADEPLMPKLGAISCPTLVLAAELDPYCPPRASEMIAGAIPGAEIGVVAGAGHCMHWEAPRATNEIIRNFIERPR